MAAAEPLRAVGDHLELRVISVVRVFHSARARRSERSARTRLPPVGVVPERERGVRRRAGRQRRANGHCGAWHRFIRLLQFDGASSRRVTDDRELCYASVDDADASGLDTGPLDVAEGLRVGEEDDVIVSLPLAQEVRVVDGRGTA